MCNITFDFRRKKIHDSSKKFDKNGLWVGLEITGDCNFQCIYCGVDSQGVTTSNFFKPIEIRNLSEVIKSFGKYVQISIVGGEPLLNPQIIDILQILTDYGFIIHLSTNSFNFTDSLIKKISKTNVTQVETNIEHTIPEIHDLIRGKKGSFQKTLLGINMLKDAGIDVLLASILLKDNIDVQTDLFELADKLECSSYRVWDVIPSGRGKSLQNQKLSNFEYFKTIKSLFQKAEMLKVTEVRSMEPTLFSTISSIETKLKINLTGCPAMRNYFNISYDKKILLCGGCRTRYIFPLQELPILSSSLKNTHKNYLSEVNTICKHCKFINECGGGCIVRVLNYGVDYRCPIMNKSAIGNLKVMQ